MSEQKHKREFPPNCTTKPPCINHHICIKVISTGVADIKFWMHKDSPGPFLYWNWLTLIIAWITIYIHYKLWDEITCPSPNLKRGKRWRLGMDKNLIPHFTVRIITYPCWGLSLSMVVKMVSVVSLHAFCHFRKGDESCIMSFQNIRESITHSHPCKS